jgi:hypothetical protein
VSKCVENHAHCNQGEATRLPKRVLEISGDIVTLREDVAGLHNYACLSHCWGPKGPAIRLTSDTLEDFKRGLGVKELPLTFQESVQVCSRLSLKYLWIDALCKYRR